MTESLLGAFMTKNALYRTLLALTQTKTEKTPTSGFLYVKAFLCPRRFYVLTEDTY